MGLVSVGCTRPRTGAHRSQSLDFDFDNSRSEGDLQVLLCMKRAQTNMILLGCSQRNINITVDTLIPHTCREPAKSMGFHRLWLVRISAHPLAPFGTHGASTSWAIGRVKYILWLTDMNVLPVTSNIYRTDIVLGICSLEWRLSAPRDLCTSP